MTESIARILVADGAELVRRGIGDVLARDRRLRMVGQIARLSDAPSTALKYAPDLIFFGLMNAGDAAALRGTVQSGRAPVIALVDGSQVDSMLEAVRAGASAVLRRDASARIMLDAVWNVLQGRGAIDPALVSGLFSYLAAPSESSASGPVLHPAVLRLLSPRERDVLVGLAHAKRNKEIAQELGVSVGTVKTHLRHIFRKLTVNDRTGAVLTALQPHDREAA